MAGVIHLTSVCFICIACLGWNVSGVAGIDCFACGREFKDTDCFNDLGRRSSCREGNEFCMVSAGNSYPKGLTFRRTCGTIQIGSTNTLQGDLKFTRPIWAALTKAGLSSGIICQEDPGPRTWYEDQRRHDFKRICVCKSQYCNNHTFEEVMEAPTILKNPDMTMNDTVHLKPSRNSSLAYQRNFWVKLDEEIFRGKKQPTVEQQLVRMREEAHRVLSGQTLTRLDLPISDTEERTQRQILGQNSSGANVLANAAGGTGRGLCQSSPALLSWTGFLMRDRFLR